MKTKLLIRLFFLFTILVGVPMVFTGCIDPKPMPPKKMDVDTFPPFMPTYLEFKVPEGFPEMEIPSDNALTQEGVFLGRKLFYDPILSGDSTLSCAGCHKQRDAFSDDRRFSIGIDGSIGNRQAMQIINAGWMTKLFWDGRANSLEEQALGPVENPIEMKAHWPMVVDRLKEHTEYPLLFHKAFGTADITKELAVKAIAQFERTMVSYHSKFDRERLGKVFYSVEEQDGYDMFFSERGDCFHCHGGVLLTDNTFHNNGLDSIPEDIGLEKVTHSEFDRGLFKTPTLRNIELTAPYMHDGRFRTLEEVIDFYSEGLQKSKTIDPLMKAIRNGGKHFSPYEKKALLAFLKTLTDTSFVHNPAYRAL